MSTTIYVTRFDYGTAEEPSVRPAVFLTAPDGLETLRSAGKVITINATEGLTAEAFDRGIREITQQVSLSPFTDVVGEIIFNSAS